MLPLFLVWVGIGETSKVGFITYATFFPMFLTTVHAVRQLDPLLVRAAQSLGARPSQLFFRVLLPAALPEMLTGIRLGVALSFLVIVISEFTGAEQGLGFLINDGRSFFLVPQMLGAAVLLGLLGYGGNALVRLVERRFLFFQAEDGIRDLTVTGVQTCALPISCPAKTSTATHGRAGSTPAAGIPSPQRSGWQCLLADAPHRHAHRGMCRSLRRLPAWKIGRASCRERV